MHHLFGRGEVTAFEICSQLTNQQHDTAMVRSSLPCLMSQADPTPMAGPEPPFLVRDLSETASPTAGASLEVSGINTWLPLSTPVRAGIFHALRPAPVNIWQGGFCPTRASSQRASLIVGLLAQGTLDVIDQHTHGSGVRTARIDGEKGLRLPRRRVQSPSCFLRIGPPFINRRPRINRIFLSWLSVEGARG